MTENLVWIAIKTISKKNTTTESKIMDIKVINDYPNAIITLGQFDGVPYISIVVDKTLKTNQTNERESKQSASKV